MKPGSPRMLGRDLAVAGNESVFVESTNCPVENGLGNRGTHEVDLPEPTTDGGRPTRCRNVVSLAMKSDEADYCVDMGAEPSVVQRPERDIEVDRSEVTCLDSRDQIDRRPKRQPSTSDKAVDNHPVQDDLADRQVVSQHRRGTRRPALISREHRRQTSDHRFDVNLKKTGSAGKIQRPAVMTFPGREWLGDPPRRSGRNEASSQRCGR